MKKKIFLIVVVGFIVTLGGMKEFQVTAEDSSIDFYGRKINFLKLFGQKKITETSSNAVTGRKVYHAAGVVVDKSSRPNKVYVADTGNNRILGFRGIGYCGKDKNKSCTLDSDCGSGERCQIDGRKDADIVFGQDNFEDAACNRDNNLGFNKKPTANSLCYMPYPWNTNITESWGRINLEIDNVGNLYVPDNINNRVLKFNQPFSVDKTEGRGDAIADFVWGQDDMNSNGINRNGYDYLHPSQPDNRSLWLAPGSFDATAKGVSVDFEGSVWIADTLNSRVLRFPANSKNADLVIGKNNFNSSDKGQGCYSSNPFYDDTNNLPKNRLCSPSLAKINPETGELFVLDEYAEPFKARILIFTPPFISGMFASRTLIPKGVAFQNWGGPVGNSQYVFQSTGFIFNTYKEGEYANGLLWINEHTANRALLIDKEGNVLKIIGAKNLNGRGGDQQYAECGSIYDPFNLWWPGGSIGIDSENNLYFTDEMFKRVSRYALPYNLQTINNNTCLPNSNGGLFPETTYNLFSDNNLGESIGLGVFENQLIIQDEGDRLKVWNNYLEKNVLGASPDFVLSRGLNNRKFISAGKDSANHLWIIDTHGRLLVYQLPLQSNSQPIKIITSFYWDDDGAQINLSGAQIGMGLAFSPNQKLYLVDGFRNRILRIKNPQEFEGQLRVDLVIGQPNKLIGNCNHDPNYYEVGEPIPAIDGLCHPYQIKFDNFGNLYVIENNYECRGGNDRISVFLNEDLINATGLFPNLQVKKVFTGYLSGRKGPCAYNTTGMPGSPVSLAFNSNNQMVVGNDGYYGNPQERQLRQLWFYNDPIKKQVPDGYIELPMGAPGEIAFDDHDNLIVQDHTWNRVWIINTKTDPSWIVSLYKQGDINFDGKVDILDLRQLLANFTGIFDYAKLVEGFGL